GHNTLLINQSGSDNIAQGYNVLASNFSGYKNIAFGYEALNSNSGGFENIALGDQVLYNNISGFKNIGLGDQALYSNQTGDENFAVGYKALYANISGYNNVGIGKYSMENNIDGISNIAIGGSTLQSNTSGSRNIAFGYGALENNIDGDTNIAIGIHALGDGTPGYRNIAIGRYAGLDAEGNNNIYIGYWAGRDDTGSNKLFIDNNGDEESTLIYGEFDNEIVAFDAKIGIGTKEPTVPFQIVTGSDADLGLGSGMVVLGDELSNNLVLDKNEIQARNGGVPASLYLQQNGGNVYVGNSIIQSSDRRLKKDINDISYGLEEVLKLQPKEYNWKHAEQKYKSLGLIAQDVQDIIKNVVTYNVEQDKYGVSYSELIPVLIKAIQEQQNIINQQQQTDRKQSRDLADLKEKINHLEAMISQGTQNN
ncbi:MAG: tail fiber domain-containing protein, partial [Bacteroidota bacterium]